MKNVDNNSIIREDLNTITSNPLPWESLANKTVLITGGTGFIGAYLVKTLLHLNQLFDLRLIIVCVTRNKTSVKTRLNLRMSFSDKAKNSTMFRNLFFFFDSSLSLN